MRAHAAAIAASGIAAGLLLLPVPATAQIVPHTSDKASAAYSPSALVQTGSRRQAFCFWCGSDAASPVHPDDGLDERQRRKRSILR